jgi:CHAT domain
LQSTFRTIATLNHPFTLLIIADQDAWFPWELFHDRQKFLGDRLIIGRWFWELEKARPYEFPVGAVNVAHYASVEQPELWTQLLHSSGAPPPVPMEAGIFNDMNLLESIRGLHLIRYGQSVEAANRQDVPVQVGSSEVEDIERKVQPAKLSLRRNHPLVSLSYVNAGQVELTALEQTWASSFVRAGCSAFIGSLWAVRSQVEVAFVGAFYQSLWAGQTLGVAFNTARRLAQTVVPESWDWLAYVLFGDPMARPYRPVSGQGYAVVEAIGQEIDDPVAPGSTVRFRVSLRRTPPVWYENRLMEVAEDLTFEDLRVFLVTSGLQVTPGDSGCG